MKWRSIETIPTDGTPVLVWMPEEMRGSHVHAARYTRVWGGSGVMKIIGGTFHYRAPSEPTHWMPQPESPV